MYTIGMWGSKIDSSTEFFGAKAPSVSINSIPPLNSQRSDNVGLTRPRTSEEMITIWISHSQINSVTSMFK
ncbi:hypothetical protein PGT21_025815 [Puccinia graminis f. sp. tritici]|uniref:Uncharacterized protein n=1 Tax=Puccinia graminis f. sp. tritici TaxID=56615 RepID=A0A5B0QJF2_PUCGR|nr:hypothetical protein PGT21_025815 [Puccinia graminis f. sp. tritici]